MEIMTRDFGKVEINQDDIITFPEGLPGFLEMKKFILLPLAEDSPFIIMQSVEESELAFITLEPGFVIGGYEFDIGEKTEKMLKLESIEDVMILNIVTIRDNDMENMTVNLAAPLVINHRKKLARQVILDNDKYPVRYKLYQQREKEKVTE